MFPDNQIVILGASGYIGHAYTDFFSRQKIGYIPLSRSRVDYSDTVALTRFLEQAKPRFLINCAGYTGKPNVDACESNKSESLLGNSVLPGIIRQACENTGTPWGHVSSGCIYTGRRPDGGGFTESDPPNFSFRTDNCSFYSGTKALGEEVLQGASSCYIWRLRIPFDHRDSPRNYLSKLLRYPKLLQAENSLSCLHDFPRACYQTYDKNLPHGIYNITNPGSVTTKEVVQMILHKKLTDKKFCFFDSENDFMKTAAKTPRSNCVLDTHKITSSGIALPHVHQAIADSIDRWQWEVQP